MANNNQTDNQQEAVTTDENTTLSDKTSLLKKATSSTKIPNGTSNLFVTILNMMKLMIGSGMLSLPWAFAHVGLIPGLIACIFCATFDFIAAMLLIYSSEITQLFEYSAVLRLIGPIWEYAGAICLLYVVSGSLVGYLILIGDFINDAIEQLGVAPNSIPAQRQIIIIAFTVCLLTPLVLLKDLSSLRFSSFIGIAAIAYCVILLVVTTIVHVNQASFMLGSAYDSNSIFEVMDWNICFFIMTNVCTQAYVCHYSVQRVYLDLKDRTVERMWIANGVSYASVCIIYVIFAVCGYILYGSTCPSDVLIAFVGGVDVVIARFAMTFSVCGTYPLAFVACQATLEHQFFSTKKNKIWNYKQKPWLRIVIILLTQCVYLILSCIIPTVGPVVSVNGAVSTIGLIALFPIAGSWKIGFDKEIYLRRQEVEKPINYDAITLSPNGSNDMMEKNKFMDDKLMYNTTSNQTKVLLSIMLVIGVVFGIMGFITEFQEVGTSGAS
eukprot:366607_1